MSERMEMETNPLCSIIIATFRQWTSLPIAIRSALNQTYPNCEIIVVPVTSDKETLRVAQDYFIDEIKVVYSDKANYVHQRNLGILNAKGKWISFADSDDYMLPAKIHSELSVALAEKAYVVYSSMLIADNHFRVVDVKHADPFSYEALLKGCFIGDCSLFAKALWLEHGGFDESKGEMAFYDFWLKTAEKYPDRFKMNPYPSLVYCQHDGQMHRRWSSEERAKQREAVVADSLERMRRRK